MQLPSKNPVNNDAGTLRALAKQMPKWFERTLLRRLYTDLEFYARLHPVLSTTSEGLPARDFADPLHNALFQVLPQYIQLMPGGYGDSVHFDTLGNLLTAAGTFGKYLRVSDVQEAINVMGQCLQLPPDMVRAVTDEYVSSWLIEKRTATLATAYKANGLSSDQYFELLAEERLRIVAALRQKANTFLFGDGVDNPPPVLSRLATGFQAYDKETGGLGATESTLIIAASGGGKSALATQLSSQVTLLNPDARVLHIYTEQFNWDMERRIISQTCKVPYRDLRDGVNLSSFTPAQYQDYVRIREKLRDRMLLQKWEFGTSVKEGIVAAYRAAQRKLGGHISLVTLDWVGGAISKDVSDPGMIRHLYQESADQMAHLAEREGCSTISFAQADEKLANNKMNVDNTTMRECKGMHQLMTSVIGVTTFLTPQGEDAEEGGGGSQRGRYMDNQWLYVSKSRKGETRSIPVRRNMGFQRFEDMSFRTR